MAEGGGRGGGRGGRGGGRGGFGGGAGRGGGGGFGGPLGDVIPDYSVTELFPPQPQPVQAPLSKEERAIVARFRSHREKIHNGPMYTVAKRKRGMEDPFNDVSKYSEKYMKKERRVPKLDARPYAYEFFPPELYPTIGKDKDTGKIKQLMFSSLDVLNPLDELPDFDEAEGEDGDKEGEKKLGADEDGAGDAGSDEDDEFDEDDDNDYNAENYFDNGDSDPEDFGDDDGGGGDYYD